MTDAGIDGENAMILQYEDGRMAVLNSGFMESQTAKAYSMARRVV